MGPFNCDPTEAGLLIVTCNLNITEQPINIWGWGGDFSEQIICFLICMGKKLLLICEKKIGGLFSKNVYRIILSKDLC